MISIFQNKFFLKILDTQSRSRKAQLNILFLFGIRITSIAISLFYVPLLIHQLNAVNYGIWLTLTSIVSWVSFCDIGLGHGLRNKLAEAIACDQDELGKCYVSTAYAVLFIFLLMVALVYVVLSIWLDWGRILNAPAGMTKELNILAFCFFMLFCIQLWLRILNSFLLAMQLPALSSFIDFLGNALGFFGVYLLTTVAPENRLLNYGLVIAVAPVIVLLFFSLLLFCTKFRKYAPAFRCIDLKYARPLLSLGGKFFLIEFTAILLFQTNNFIIAHIADPSGVTDFNIAYKYLGILSAFFGIVSLPIWSATTDAFYRGDYDWIKRTIRVLNCVLIIAVLGGIGMVCAAPCVYRFWLKGALVPNAMVIVLVFLYNVFSMICAIYCKIINGIGKVKLQFYFTLFEALLHIPLAFILGRFLGVTGVLISMCLMGFINVVWEPIQVRKLLDKTAAGVWNK